MQMQSSFANMQAGNFRVVKSKKRLKKLLIIDDDSTILASFSLMFQSNKNDIDVITADSVSAALIEYNRYEFDVIILDHHLPRASGTTFIQKTNAKNVFYFSGGYIHPETVWPYKENIVSIFQKPDCVAIYKSVLEHLGLEYKPYKSKLSLITKTEEERSADSFKSRRQYRRDFKKQFGMNQNEYINGEDGVKIGWAKKLLREKMSVLIVANTLCYKYRQNFERFFKSKTGMTPGEYRKEYA